MLGRNSLPNLPFRFSGVDVRPRRAAPVLGEHNAEIASMPGYASDEIAATQHDAVLHAEQPDGRW